jgi:hypothetical protein
VFRRWDANPTASRAVELELILADGTAYPNKGRTAALDRQVDVTTGTVLARGVFPNPGSLLRPGQYAKIRATNVRKGALVIPQRAVQDVQGVQQVAVVRPDETVDLRKLVEGVVELLAPPAQSKGVEIAATGDPQAKLTWSASYTRSSAIDVIDGTSVPRSWDQPHAGKVLVAYRWNPGWFVAADATVHTAANGMITKGAVLVQSNKIIGVYDFTNGASVKLVVPSDATFVNLHGQHLYPGLIAANIARNVPSVAALAMNVATTAILPP